MKKSTGWLTGTALFSVFSLVFYQLQFSDETDDKITAIDTHALVEVKTDTPQSVDVNSENISKLGYQVQQLGLQLSMLSEKMEVLSSQASANNTSVMVSAGNDSNQSLNLNNTDRQYQAELEMQQQMQALENNFQAQDIDPSFSQTAESRILEAFNNPELSGTHGVQNIECRGSLCKLDVVSQSEEGSAGGFHEKLRDQISDILPAGAMQPNGSGGVTVYLAKSPEELKMQ